MTDREFLDLWQEEERRNYAFNLLLRQYTQQLYWHIRKMVGDHDVANDLLQNTWIKVWQHLDGFRGDSKLVTWLYTIATHETLSHLRKERLRSFLTFSGTQVPVQLEASEDLDGERLQRKLQKAILTLPPKQRSVFVLRYFEELPYEEIAAITHTSEGALKASYHHAYKKIEQILRNSD